MKKLVLSVILALLCLAFMSCGDTGDNINDDNADEPGNIESTPDTEDNQDIIRDSLPDNLDFNGATLNLLTRGDCNVDTGVPEFGAETEIGDIINDIIYRRDKLVEERLNLNLNVIAGQGWQNYNADVSMIRATIAAGDNSFDLIAGWSARIPALAVEGLLMNILELPHLDLSQPWWNHIIVDEMTISNKLPFAVGDGNLSLLANCMVIFSNNELQQEYGLPNIYDTVFEGKWTIDYMNELSRKVGADLNGDGVMDGNDLYGVYIGEGNRYDGFMQSSNIKMTSKDASGIPYLNIEYDKLSTLVNKVYELVHNNPSSYVTSDPWTFSTDMFKKDQTLLAAGWLLMATESLRDMESDYSIVPYPKFDEEQNQYYSRIQDGVSLFCLPINCGKTEMVAAFMEAAASESYRSVSPAYFDVAMKLKFARDETSAKMLDIIRDGAYLNFASVYNESIGNPWFVMRDLLTTGSNNFASWFDRNEPRIVAGIDKLVNQMESTD